MKQEFGDKKFFIFGAAVILLIGLISFHPSLRVGFMGDDWDDVAFAAKSKLADYLKYYFDPTTQPRWYRPMYGISVLVQYSLFGAMPEGYHVVQLSLHLANTMLLFIIVRRLYGRGRLAWLAAAVFVCLPVLNGAVSWVAVHDPLAMFFYLLAVSFWIAYLTSNRRVPYFAAFGAAILALLAKEASVFLPVTLFLIDRLIVNQETARRDLILRYAPFGILFATYLLVETRVQSISYFTTHWGYGIGFHMVPNMLRYLSVLVFPWGLDEPFIYIVLFAVSSVYVTAMWRARSKELFFLAISIIIAIFPVTGFPEQFFYPRYAYSAAMAWGIILAIALERGSRIIRNHPWHSIAPAMLAGFLLLINSSQTLAATMATAELARQFRIPFRDITQQHPTYSPDTYIYFFQFPYPYILRNLRGMFYLRYGSNVTVWNDDAESGGWDKDRFAQLRDHRNSFVYYLDESRQRVEVAVNPNDTSAAMPALPVDYEVPIRLLGYELTSNAIKPGETLVLFLYWQAPGEIDEDYTVFIHLTNAKGEIALGEDSQPRGGRLPTSKWLRDKLVVDAHILTIPSDVPPGEYRLEVGLYFPPTLERVLITNENNRPVDDKVVIVPLKVLE